MVGLKSLFRRKSKKDLGDRSNTPTPSPGRSHSSAANRAQTPTPSSPPPLPQSANTTPMQNKFRNSQGGFSAQQSPSGPGGGTAATRYDQLSSGTTPERGTYPVNGSGTGGQGFPTGQPEYQTPDNRSESVGRTLGGVAGTHNIARRSIPPGMPVSPDVSANRERSASQSSAYTDRSRYTDGLNAPRYGQSDEIPPVPSAPLNAYKRSTIGALPDGNSAANHNRVVSASSAVSSPRTPIADQFAAPSWYNQRGSPPVPEFSQVHPMNTNKTASNVANGNVPQQYSHNTVSAKPPTNNLREEFNTSGVADRSAALGHALDSSDRNGHTQIQQVQQQVQQRAAPVQTTYEGPSLSNGDYSAASKVRRQSIPRKSLEKPLPVPVEQPYAAPTGRTNGRDEQVLPLRERAPVTASAQVNQSPPSSPTPLDAPSSPVRTGKYMKSPAQNLSKGEIRSGQQQIYDRSYLVQGAPNPPSLQGIVDLNNTVDTTTHVHYAPAVLHEMVLPHVHHVRDEQITREIHNYNVHHRLMPVIDVQVLPPKHIVRTDASVDGQWVEVPEELVPGRFHQNWLIAETVSRIPGPVSQGIQAPRQFTARAFTGTDGDYREYTNENGVPTTETTWVHPPTISHEARRRGLTLPLDME